MEPHLVQITCLICYWCVLSGNYKYYTYSCIQVFFSSENKCYCPVYPYLSHTPPTFRVEIFNQTFHLNLTDIVNVTHTAFNNIGDIISHQKKTLIIKRMKTIYS